MPSTPPFRLQFAERFRCIGSACEDTCCQGWSVPVDQAAYAQYQNLPVSPLRTQIDASILVNIQPAPVTGHSAEAARPASFAQIRMNAANRCPLLTEDRLCRIHAELGEEFLPRTCATYPRIATAVGGVEETALALSCPEAARLVLLDPNLLPPAPLVLDLSPGPMASPQAGAPTSQQEMLRWFWPIRQVVLAVLRNRAYPLWQRMFLLSLLCRRLDAIASGELRRGVPEFLNDFAASMASGALRPAMESLPLDRAAQMDVVLRLAGLLLHRSSITPRFIACVEAFTAGIGNGPSATLASLTARYNQAHDYYYAPFFDRNPHILENYLANTILRCRFPFGREGAEASAPVSMSREFALLTAQFALVKGLLIGVAGEQRASFSAAHVVHAIQASSKHFEHHLEFRTLAHELLVESRMDGARGLSILLRNAEPNPFRCAQPPLHVPAPPPLHAPAPKEIAPVAMP